MDIREIIYSINPNAICGVSTDKDGVSTIDWLDGTDPIPQSELDAKLVEMEAEYDAQEYARKSKAEFPSIQDLVVALYDTDDKSAVEAKRAAVKAKYPKP